MADPPRDNESPTLAEPLASRTIEDRPDRTEVVSELAPSTELGGELPTESIDRYTVSGIHGHGGQAQVFLAFDETMKREVALKVLREHDVPNAPTGSGPAHSISGRRRFLREARVTAQLEHPNIVPVHELGRRQDGALYYTMRLVRGRTLAQALKECKSLADRLKLLGPFWDMCNAIAFAHSRGVVHRDLKPENVMVGEFGETVLLDWGVAKVKGERDIRADDLKHQIAHLQQESDETQAGTAVGTPSYMSPEQAMGKVDEIDDRSDVWGLGAVLYKLLTGNSPFKRETARETLHAVAYAPLVPVLTVAKSAPRELVAIAEKCLQKQQAARYQSAREVAAEVDAFMTGGRVRAYRYTNWELVKRFYAQNKTVVVAAGVLLLVVVAALVVVSLSLGAETRAKESAQQAQAREYQEHLSANFHLAQAFTEKAEGMAQEQTYLSATLFAAAALLNNPAHPHSPFFNAEFARGRPESRESRVVAASRLYQDGFHSLVSLERVLSVPDSVEQVAFSPDGRLLAAASGRRVLLWEKETGRMLPPLEGGEHDYFYSLSISPDGTRLAGGARDGVVTVWVLATRTRLQPLKGHSASVRDVQFCGNHRLVSVGQDSLARVWELPTGRIVATLKEQKQRLNGVACSADGRLVAIGSEDATAVVYDVAKAKPIGRPLVHPARIRDVAVSQDGRWLATACDDGRVRVFDTKTGSIEHVFEGHQGGVTAVALSPDNELIASLSYDKSMRLWDRRSGRPLLTVRAHDDFPYGLAFSADGRSLATGAIDRTVKVWDLQPLPQLALEGHTARIYSLGFSRDGKRLASAGMDKTVRVWDVKSRAAVRLLKGHTEAVDGGVAFDAAGGLLASAGRDGTVRIWEVASGKARHVLNADRNTAYGVSVSPDGKVLASSGQEGVVRLWKLGTGKPILTMTGHEGVVDRTAFSPDGKMLATAGYDHTVRLWDPATGRQLKTLRGHTDWVSGVAFSPDGKLVASSGKDHLAIIWNVATGEVVRRLHGHSQWVNDVRFSGDGKLIATGSDDGTVRVWAADSGDILLILRGRSEVVAFEFSPDSKLLAVGDGNDVELYPVDLTALDVEPGALLERAQRQAGYLLNGFELKPMVDGDTR